MDVQLIDCPACQNKCSALASTCPSCGHPFGKEKDAKASISDKLKIFSQRLKPQTEGSKKWMIATLILGVLVVGVLSYAAYSFYTNSNFKQGIFNSKNSLTIKAAIVYKVGGAQPIARTTFYLSKKDLETTAKEARIQTSTSAASLWAFEENTHAQLGMKGTSRFVEAFKPFVVSTATTDFNGDAKFESVPSGSYYLIGVAPTRSGMAVWNLPVNINSNQSLMIDQSNAVVAD